MIFYRSLIAWCLIAFHAPQLWLMFFLVVPVEGAGGFGDFCFNAMLLIGWGILHSLLARKPVKHLMTRFVGMDFVKIVYISIAGITQCMVLYYFRPLNGVLWETEGFLYAVLMVLFFMCVLAVFIFSLQLDYMEVLGVRSILKKMNGITESDGPPELCLKGGYRYCRHPVYLATILLLWVGPVMTASRFEMAFFWTIYVIIGSHLEDKDTMKEFGEPYEEYKMHVPLLIPRISPWQK